METFSALLPICVGNSPVPGEFPTQRPVTRGFDVFFDPCLNKRLRKQSRGWWFETLSWPLWRHRNAHFPGSAVLRWILYFEFAVSQPNVIQNHATVVYKLNQLWPTWIFCGSSTNSETFYGKMSMFFQCFHRCDQKYMDWASDLPRNTIAKPSNYLVKSLLETVDSCIACQGPRSINLPTMFHRRDLRLCYGLWFRQDWLYMRQLGIENCVWSCFCCVGRSGSEYTWLRTRKLWYIVICDI